MIGQFPHCDARVLHAPGCCDFCDRHPDWQELRRLWGIAFTGKDPKGDEVRCPAERQRTLEKVEVWGGNRPHSTGSRRRRMIEEAVEGLRSIAEGL